jgi:hypothetical protein
MHKTEEKAFNVKEFKATVKLLASQYDGISSNKKEGSSDNKQFNQGTGNTRSGRFSEWTDRQWEDWSRGGY